MKLERERGGRERERDVQGGKDMTRGSAFATHKRGWKSPSRFHACPILSPNTNFSFLTIILFLIRQELVEFSK